MDPSYNGNFNGANPGGMNPGGFPGNNMPISSGTGDIVLSGGQKKPVKWPIAIGAVVVVVLVVIFVCLNLGGYGQAKYNTREAFDRLADYILNSEYNDDEDSRIMSLDSFNNEDTYLADVSKAGLSQTQLSYFTGLEERAEAFLDSVERDEQPLDSQAKNLMEMIKVFSQISVASYSDLFLVRYLEDNNNGIRSYIDSVAIFDNHTENGFGGMLWVVERMAKEYQTEYSLLSQNGCIVGGIYNSDCASEAIFTNSRLSESQERIEQLLISSRHYYDMLISLILQSIRTMNGEIANEAQ